MRIDQIFIRLLKGKEVVLDSGQLQRLLNYARSLSGDYSYLIRVKGNRVTIKQAE